LNAAENTIAKGETRPKKILAEVAQVMGTEPLVKFEYAVVIDPELIGPVSNIQGTVIVGVGGKIGNCFLYDAIVVERSAER
jgi:pantothenate synthetase